MDEKLGCSGLKLKILNNEKEEEEEEDKEGVVVELPYVCPLCGKRFKSGYALGGHKKTHNRSRRLIFPSKKALSHPKSQLLISSTEHHHDDDHDDQPSTSTAPPPPPLTKSWALIGKRGRKSSITSSEVDETLREAAHNLIMLSQDKNYYMITKKRKLLADHHDEDNSHGQKSSTQIKMKSVVDDDDDDLDQLGLNAWKPKVYTCNTCGKSFSSYYALGGHMRSHNKIT